MGKRIFTASVILAKSPGDTPEVFKIGDVVPDWALDMIGDHVSQGTTRATTAPTVEEQHDDDADADEVEADADSDDDGGEYDDLNKDELKKLAKSRGVAGYSGMAKQELIDALEADDAEEEDDE